MKKENTYIMNLEACYIYKDIQEHKNITYKKRDLAKLFSATMPYSLETIRMDEMFDDVFYEVNKKQYTRKIINVTFDKHYTIWDEDKEWEDRSGKIRKGKRIRKASKNKIRKDLYKNGFIMDGIHYVFYKRGAGKAKNGYAFFIDEKMKDKLINRSRLGVKFEEDEELDLTSLLAYESLISSGIEFTINLNPKTEILLIDDIYGKEFESKASVTREVDGEIVTKDEIIKIQNCLTDGQNLLDESVFVENSDKLIKKYKTDNKGFMLLRSDMYKGCAFNTKLQKWFKHNNVEQVKDMFGNLYSAKDVKLITTPNSLKFLKFAYKFTDSGTMEEYKNMTNQEQFEVKSKCYDYWKNNIDNIFGVVKCDKSGNYGNYNRTTYQLLNSIPNLTYEALLNITELERNYVMLLKNDDAVFRNYLGCDAKASLKFEDKIEKNDISLYETTDLMTALMLVNSDFQYTKKFKDIRSKLISNYINNLKRGKIRLKDSKYLTIVSNPYEMLLASIGKYEGVSIMEGREVYCSYYKDGQRICASRNPHVNCANVMATKNVYRNEYKWFNFTDDISAINFYDNDAPDRLQGCDTDSDTFLTIINDILCESAKYCEDNFATPINKVKGSSKPRKNNMEELMMLDVVLSDNYIGKIINLSQIINSYLNEAIYNNLDKSIINELFQTSSKLSSMSQIEIDKSKKVFDNIDMRKELSKIRKMEYIEYVREQDDYGQECNKMVVPEFFKMISDSNNYRKFKRFHTPLDILQDVLKFRGANRRGGDKHKEIIDLMVKTKDLDGIYQRNSAISIYKIVQECGKRINGLKLKTCTLNEAAKKTVEKQAKKAAMDKLNKLSPNDSTVLGVLKQAFGDKKNDKLGFKKYAMLTLNLLYASKKQQVLKCFRSKNMNNDDVLVKMKDKCDYEIFGEKFQKIVRKDLNI